MSIVMLNEKVIGMFGLQPYGEKVSELIMLWVDEDFRRQRLSTFLIRWAVESAWAKGNEKIFACTTSESVLRIFEQHNFYQVEKDYVPDEKWLDYPSDRNPFVVMRFKYPVAPLCPPMKLILLEGSFD